MEFRKKILTVLILGVLIVGFVGISGVLLLGKQMRTTFDEQLYPIFITSAQQQASTVANSAAEMFDGFFDKISSAGHIAASMVLQRLELGKTHGITPDKEGYAQMVEYSLMPILEIVKRADPAISSVYYGDIYGNMFIYPKQQLPEGYDPRVRPWYKAAVEAGKGVWTEPYRDASTGKWVITYAVPVYEDDGELMGVVGLDVFLDTITEYVKTVKLGDTGYLYLVDKDTGLIVAHPNEDYIMNLNVFQEKELKPIADVVQSNKERGSISYTWKGVDAVVSYRKLKYIDWYVFAKVPVTEVTKDLATVSQAMHHLTNNITRYIIIIITLIVIGTTGIGYKLVASALTPLVQLRNVAHALAEGRLSEVAETLKKIRYLEKDDIGALIKAFEAVSKDMLGTLYAISKKLERLAEGDLSNGLSVEAKGELREIIDDLRTVSEKLKGTIGEIIKITDTLEKRTNMLAQIANDVTESINQVNEAVQQVSIEAQRQQESINEITEGMRLVAEISEESVRSMEEFESAVGEVVNIATEGGRKGEESAKQIESIQDMMGKIESAVSKVAEMSKSIEEITNVITNIAEQTNLLALNAAIEAARAGEAGRGFAVVAQEIRKLAEESKQAADNIKDIIDKITDEIRSAVEATEKGVKVVAESSDTLRETISYLTNIADLLQDTSARMSEVKTQITRTQEEIDKALKALENLAASAEETTASAEEVSSAMEEQAAAVEELKRSVNDLKNIVESLRGVISKFRL